MPSSDNLIFSIQSDGFKNLLLNFFEYYINHSDKPDELEKLYQNSLRKLSRSILLGLIWAILILILFTWPSDYLLYTDSEVLRNFFWWKAISVLLTGSFLIGISISDFIHKWFFEIYSLLLVPLVLASIGYLVGELEELTFLLITGSIAPLYSFPLPYNLWKRIPIAYLFLISYIGPYIYANPKLTQDPYLYSKLVMFAGFTVLYVVIGHMFIHVTRLLFFKPSPLKERN